MENSTTHILADDLATPSTSKETTNVDEEEIKLASALFQLKTLEERKVTQTALNGIIGDVQALWDITLSKIQQHCKDKNLDILQDLPSYITRPFQGLETDHQRQKYFKETLNYIVSDMNINT